MLASNTPDVLTETTADFGFALMMAAVRRIAESEHFLRAGRWTDAPIDPFDLAGKDGLTVDGPVAATAHDPDLPPVAEDAGVELIDGAKARRCRTAIDGTIAIDAFLPIRWLAGGDPVTAQIGRAHV